MQPSSFISHLSSFTTPSLTSHASPVGFNEHEEYTMQWKHHLETTGMSTISLDQTHDQELKEDDDDEVEEEEAHEEWMEQDELLALRNLPRLIKNHEKDMDKEEIFKLPWEQKKVRDGGGVLPLSRSSFSFSTQSSSPFMQSLSSSTRSSSSSSSSKKKTLNELQDLLKLLEPDPSPPPPPPPSLPSQKIVPQSPLHPAFPLSSASSSLFSRPIHPPPSSSLSMAPPPTPPVQHPTHPTMALPTDSPTSTSTGSSPSLTSVQDRLLLELMQGLGVTMDPPYTVPRFIEKVRPWFEGHATLTPNVGHEVENTPTHDDDEEKVHPQHPPQERCTCTCSCDRCRGDAPPGSPPPPPPPPSRPGLEGHHALMLRYFEQCQSMYQTSLDQFLHHMMTWMQVHANPPFPPVHTWPGKSRHGREVTPSSSSSPDEEEKRNQDRE